jgi:hypothetical protein
MFYGNLVATLLVITLLLVTTLYLQDIPRPATQEWSSGGPLGAVLAALQVERAVNNSLLAIHK